MPTTKRTEPDADLRGVGVKEEFVEALGAAP
ncbi:hypothetical protein J2W30_003499 [Variovorax boronicumulans]|nr:hypothetical protein [Variovorax boronicumulans]